MNGQKEKLLDPTECSWFDDPDEVVAFARWFFQGPNFGPVRVSPSEVIDVFEKPWEWDEEYQGYKEAAR